MAFVPQLFRNISANMWTPLIVTYCAVYLTQSKEVNDINRDLGPVHIHVNTTKLPPSAHPREGNDKHATEKAITLVNFVKVLPDLNPLKGAHFGPYDASIPDLLIYGNLTLENVTVTGIKDLRLQSIEMQLAPDKIDFNASIPRITVEADFDLKADYSGYLPINDRGHFKITLLDVVVSAVIGPKSVQSHIGPVYQLETADLTIDLKDVQLEMNMDQYAEEFKLILNGFVKDVEDIIVDNDVLHKILKKINQELEKIPAKKIVNFSLGISEPSLRQRNPYSKRRPSRNYGRLN